MIEKHKQGLPPLLCENPEILILGSLPGDESIRLQEYYANPRNRFWSIIAGVFEESAGFSYSEKKAFLAKHYIALWDTIAEARREGSLDSNIEEERYNDIAGLMKKCPSINTIVLNGGKSAKAFKEYLKANPSKADFFLNCRILKYASSSALSASAGWSLDCIIEQWKGMLTHVEY